MPIDGVLDLQRRSAPLGEIRIGYSTVIPGKKGRQPRRSETFIFTTDEFAAGVVAAKYGGTPAPWDRRKGRWAVTTNRSRLNVWVPPRGLAIDANMELWDGGRCLRKCTGSRMLYPKAGPCQCPQPEDPSDPGSVQRARDERRRLAALRTPQACRPRLLINVVISDLPGLTGVWRLASGSESAAVETADQGDMLAHARDAGAYLPAAVLIDWRFRIADGSPYPVIVVRIGMSAEDLACGELPPGAGGLLSQIRAGTGEVPAIGAAPDPEPPPPAGSPLHYETADLGAAQRYADLAAQAATSAEVRELHRKAAAEGVPMEDLVCTGPGRDVYDRTIREVLQDRWKELHARERQAAQAAAGGGDGDG